MTHFIIAYHISLVNVQTNYCNNNLLILNVKQFNKIIKLYCFYDLKSLWDGQGKIKMYYRMSRVKEQLSRKRRIEDLGNPFADDSFDLYALDTKLVTSKEAIQDLNQVLTTGNKQVQHCCKQCFLNREVPITDTIPKNRYLFFTQMKARTSSKVKEKCKVAKSDVALFFRLFISCQVQQGDLEQFFAY